ncbi:MAG: hypothetical protein ABIE74_00015 [Pseudomonadota bacterium]
MVANSTLTGVPANGKDVSRGLDIQAISKDVTIIKATITNFDIGIDAQGENIIVEESSITKNKMYGIRADSKVKNLSMSKMISLSENGDGIEASDAFMLEEGANSGIKLIDADQKKATFYIPMNSEKDQSVKFIDFYEPTKQDKVQPQKFLLKRHIKPTEFTKKDDSITITDPALRGKYIMVTCGNTISTKALWVQDEVIIATIPQTELPSGGAGMTGDPASPESQEGDRSFGGGSEFAFAGGKAGCSLMMISTQKSSTTFFQLLFLIIPALILICCRIKILRQSSE